MVIEPWRGCEPGEHAVLCVWGCVYEGLSGCGDGLLDEDVGGEVCDDGDIFDWRGDCLGDCSGPTRCADDSTHLGECAPIGRMPEGQQRLLSAAYEHHLRFE